MDYDITKRIRAITENRTVRCVCCCVLVGNFSLWLSSCGGVLANIGGIIGSVVAIFVFPVWFAMSQTGD